MPRVKLAPVLAAYLVSCDPGMARLFSKMKVSRLDYLEDNLVNGAVLVHAEADDIGGIMAEMTDAIAKTVAMDVHSVRERKGHHLLKRVK